MIRPQKPRFLSGKAKVSYFKPREVPLRILEEVSLMPDEFEAIKLYSYNNLSQIDSAECMGISQPTFARILDCAYKKVAEALVCGKAIKIEKYSHIKKRIYK